MDSKTDKNAAFLALAAQAGSPGSSFMAAAHPLATDRTEAVLAATNDQFINANPGAFEMMQMGADHARALQQMRAYVYAFSATPTFTTTAGSTSVT